MDLSNQFDSNSSIEPEFLEAQVGDIPSKYFDVNKVPRRVQSPVNVDSYYGMEFIDGLKSSLLVGESSRPKLEAKLNSYFPDVKQGEEALCTLCVRSTFDMYFQARNFPKGSEVIMTGMNIPDMVKIINEHGLVQVPVPINLASLRPKVEDIKKVITPNTKAIVIAYVYGVTYDCSYIAQALEGTGIEILEDCA